MHRSRTLVLALAALLVAGGLGVAIARVQPMQPVTDDRSFIDLVAERNHAAIDMGERAGESENPAIRVIGEQMVHELREMNQQVMAVARDKGIEPPAGPALASRAKTSVVGLLPDAMFDRDYISSQIENRREVLALMQVEAGQRDDLRLQVLATQAVPVVQKQIAALELPRQDPAQR